MSADREAATPRPLRPLDLPLDGVALVEASAGTGKTFTITSLYLRGVVERGLEASEILVVTYTNAATAELRARVRDRIRQAIGYFDRLEREGDAAAVEGDDELLSGLAARATQLKGGLAEAIRRLRIAQGGFDDAAISTIHSYCQRILQDHAFESGARFDAELVADLDDLLEAAAVDYIRQSLDAADPALVRRLMGGRPRDREFSPSGLVALARRALRDPDLVVLPGRPEDERAFDRDIEAWQAAVERARASVIEQAAAVRASVEAYGALHKGSYDLGKIETKWWPDLERRLAAAVPGAFEGQNEVVKFTPAGLHKGSAKKAREAAEAEGRRAGPDDPGVFAELGRLVELDAKLLESIENRRLQLLHDWIDRARAVLAEAAESGGERSFDDLLIELREALRGPKGSAVAASMRARTPLALIDEFQDTDPVQYEIFRRVWVEAPPGVAPPTGLVLIGDPKQAIYGFRGADIHTYLAARRDAKDGVYTLDVNWRSDPGVVEAVAALYRSSEAPFLFPEIDYVEVGPRPRAEDVMRSSDGPAPALRVLVPQREAPGQKLVYRDFVGGVCRGLAADVSRLLRSGTTLEGRPITPGDVAVLCRTGLQLAAVKKALGQLGIPSVERGDATVFETLDALEIEWILRAMVRPTDAGYVRAALATTVVGERAADIAARDEEAFDAWVARFQTWGRTLERVGFIQAWRAFMHEQGVAARLLARPDGERRMTNLEQLAELLQRAVTLGYSSAPGLVDWLARARVDEAARGELASDDALLRLESDARCVGLLTIHRSKGLEFPIVYCPTLWHEAKLQKNDERHLFYHDPEDGDRAKLHLEGKDATDALRLARREAFAEGLRLLYVAITRAKHQLCIVWGPLAGYASASLTWLLHGAGIGADAPDPMDALREQVKDLDDAALVAPLEELARGSEGRIEVTPLDSSIGKSWQPPVFEAGALAPAPRTRRLVLDRRTSSFSGLVAVRGDVREARRSEDHPALQGYDYDAGSPLDPLPAGPTPSEPAEAGSLVRLHAFPAGAVPGTCLHAILEELDFTAPIDAETEALVDRLLRRHGLDPIWRPVVCDALRDTLQAPLGLGDARELRLESVARDVRLDELEFTLPVVGAPLTPERLAAIFAEHATGAIREDYPEELSRLDFVALKGFLRGFVDLVFEADSRFYLVDYKSNRLGTAPEDYRPEALLAPMLEHHYVLQYHLYLVALDRFLSTRLPDYDYDRHIGGVGYLFLRGLSPERAPGHGVYFDRPSRALVRALSEALGGEGVGRAEARA